jgi:hypothetical protein
VNRSLSGLILVGLLACGVTVSWSQQAPSIVVLTPDQAIPLRLLSQISSTDSKPNDKVLLEARTDVVVNGRVIVKRGAPASAIVVVASKHFLRGQGGRLGLQLNSVTLADGETLALDSNYKKGGGGLGKKTYIGLAAASVVLLSPAGAAFLLLNHGAEIVLPEGTAVEGYVGSDTSIAASKMELADASLSGVKGPNGAPKELEALPKKLETLAITTSAGDGSIRVDGKFQGEAPTSVELSRGMRVVVINRDGFKEWKRKVLVEGDGLKLQVSLVAK